MANRNDRSVEIFFDLATQYYVAARLAARSMLVPVHGNLFHHSIEMYLKGALLSTVSIEEMNKYHSLVALWDRFKKREDDPALAVFDATIEQLHRFESIRNPENIVDHGMMAGVVWQAHHPGTGRGSVPLLSKFQVTIATIDDLVVEILGRAGFDPKFLTTRIWYGAGRDALEYQNWHADKWLDLDSLPAHQWRRPKYIAWAKFLKNKLLP